ncbi:MAG: hypothetical protein IAE84_09810 [Saprospiraceae bacterium]|jgi:hypothetical protein|nr:hypothetical protein [Saprospiraceae bacterium]HRD79231.1 hypothetical protein [Saprospiraceae bacterium]HRK81103.1 hypothetical protein [Saprospiraceae bacterium]
MTVSAGQHLTLDISLEQIMDALMELPASEKLQVAEKLRAAAAGEKWRLLSPQLPDMPDISMDEIVAELKSVRKARKQSQ